MGLNACSQLIHKKWYPKLRVTHSLIPPLTLVLSMVSGRIRKNAFPFGKYPDKVNIYLDLQEKWATP
jgi:hypothetical protein